MIIKILILISYIIENIFDFVLVKLNDSYVKKPLPENVKDVYDEDKYNKWIIYRNDSKKFSALQTLISAGITLLIYIFNVHSKIFGIFPFNQYINNITRTIVNSIPQLWNISKRKVITDTRPMVKILPITNSFMMSMINVLIEVLLNPYFSSITKLL